MTDLYHYFGEDLQLDEEGALRSVDGALATRQNILRRLCTNPKAYLWHSEYGAGLPARVGTPIREVETQGLITAQLALEASVSRSAGDRDTDASGCEHLSLFDYLYRAR